MSELEDPIAQIRERTYTIDTPSLVQAGNEPVPEEIVRDLLIHEWHETEQAPRPRVLIADEEIQVDPRREDFLVVTITQYEETFMGHRHEHVNINVPVEIEIITSHSRQRMWNLMGEIRRIIYKWMLALRPYQSLSFGGFRPDYNGPRHYSGVVSLNLTAEAVPVIRRVITGMQSPNTDPEDYGKNEATGVS